MNHLLTRILQFIFLFSFLAFISCSPDEEVNIVYPEGGYKYPDQVANKDTAFCYYPLKDSMSTRDSFLYATSNYFFNFFEEHNLSLKPENKTIFRLIYSDMRGSSIITLTPDQIIVKKKTKGWGDRIYDTTRLTQRERFHLDILQWFFPLNDTSYKQRKRTYFDSLSKSDPELLDANYYKYLIEKSAYYGPEKFEYSLKKIPIQKKNFIHLVDLINKSGYWQLPFDNWCPNIPNDAGGFTLEANTPGKYNVVSTPSCPDDSTKYVKACQEIIKYAKMDKEIRLIWDGSTTTDEPIKVKELTLEELKEEPAPKPKKKKAK